LEFLDDLTDQQIRSELEKWQPYNSMTLGDQGRMLMRIQEFRDRRTKIAQDEAQKLSLNNLAPADQLAFKKMFWQLQRQVDDQLITEFQSQYDAKEHEMEHALIAKFAPLVPPRTPTAVKMQAPEKIIPTTTSVSAIQSPVPKPSADITPSIAPNPKVTPDKATPTAKPIGKPKPTAKPKSTPTPTPTHKPTPSPTPTKHS
jgi:cell division septation protein DedD